MKQVKVIALTFFQGRRLRPGTKLYVKDDMHRKWFVPVEKEAKPVAAGPDTNKKVEDDVNDLI